MLDKQKANLDMTTEKENLIDSKYAPTETLLTYEDGRKKILTNNWGYAKPGEIVSIMGASGGGKTSLLNILA